MSLEDQVMVIFAGTNGFADKISPVRMRAWEASLLRFLETSHPDIGRDIAEKKLITEQTQGKLRAALEVFTKTWQ
jgi:F-type H+-transporting ATPase subunit alpha